YASLPDVHLGRLTEDVAAPGFDALSALVSPDMMKHAGKPAPARPSESPDRGKMAAAKALQQAEHALEEARMQARRMDAAMKQAAVEVKQAEQRKQEAEDLFRKAKAAYEEAAKAVHNATRA